MMNEDRQTAERVYREYYPRILGYVRSKLSSPQEAEDVCSSAMLKIVRGLPTFDSGEVLAFHMDLYHSPQHPYGSLQKPTES